MHSRLKILIGAVAVAASFTSVAYAFSGSKVDQSALQFSQQTVKLKRGETLMFSNSDRTSHNITVSGGSMNFDGGLQRPGQDLEVPFTAAGTFQVTCGIHPKMAMTVQVE
jgi:plastocyanin